MSLGRFVCALCFLGSCFVPVGPLLAETYGNKDLSLRLPAAFSRFATYGDVAGAGGASGGSMWSSSQNPAAAAWRDIPGPHGLSLAPQYSLLKLGSGTRLNVFSEAATWDSGPCAHIQPAIAQVRSNRASTRDGLDFKLEMDLVQVMWGKVLDEDSAIGAGVSFSRSESHFDLGPLDVSDSRDETYGVRVGALRRCADRWLAGVVFDYAFSPSRTTLYDFMALGTGDVRVYDTTHQFLLRPGVSWEYKPDSSLYINYQLAAFVNDTGTLIANRFFMGVDHELIDGLYVRAGTAMDTKGNTSWTTGLGIYPCETVALDIAFQYDMFPELRTEFGLSRTVTISMSFTF